LVRSVNPNAPESVHLSDYPAVEEELVDTSLENDMRLARDLIGLGRAARNQSGIKTRQPIGRIAIGGISDKQQNAVNRLSALVLDELNVKEISYHEGIDEFASYTIKPNFKLLGPKYGKNVQAIAKAMALTDALTLKQELDGNGELEIQADGVNYTLDRTEVDVQSENREGYAVEADAYKFVALSTELTHELILEGFARELVNKIQQIRKEADFNVSDRISLSLESTPIVHEAFGHHRDYITHETLTLHVLESPSPNAFLKSQKVNGEDATIGVEQVT
jgi:isoleucyl-tRNA synthetase